MNTEDLDKEEYIKGLQQTLQNWIDWKKNLIAHLINQKKKTKR